MADADSRATGSVLRIYSYCFISFLEPISFGWILKPRYSREVLGPS